MNFLVRIPNTYFRLQISLKANESHPSYLMLLMLEL